MTKFAIVGSGWRAEFYWRLAAELDGLDCVGVVSRRPKQLPVPVCLDLDECLRQAKPDFVVTSVPWSVTPGLITELAGRGVKVLAETPPAPDLDGLRELWADVGDKNLVQAAEQYSRMPAHAARINLLRSGVIGEVTRADVSSTHQYHAVSLIRALLGKGRGQAEIRAFRATTPWLIRCRVTDGPTLSRSNRP